MHRNKNQKLGKGGDRKISRNKIKPPKENYEIKINNLSDKEFKVMIIKMLKELRRRVNEQNEKVEVFNKELENMRKIQR